MASRKVAVVTGGNKGIGFATVRGLCKQFDGDVYLTARNEELGKKAVEDLSKEGLTNKPKFHQLDITDGASVQRLKDFLQKTYGGLDVLVNNAAIAYKASSTAPFSEQAEVTIATNYTALLNVCNTLFPLLRPHARVVNVSSFVSTYNIKKCSPEVKAKFTSPTLTVDQCTSYLNEFVQVAKEGDHEKKGYANSAYGMSKIGVSALTNVQGREMAKDPREDVVVNAADPGHVQTDMSSQSGNKNTDEGADTLVYLAMLTPGTDLNGKFVSDRKVQDWANAELSGTRYS